MRKVGIVTLVLLTGSVLLGNIVSGAAVDDLVSVKSTYDREHSQYLLAKNQFQQAGTLASQTKAERETLDMLEARDDVVVQYLRAVRERIVGAQGVDESGRGGLIERIDTEIAWFGDHKDRLSSAGGLSDLAANSDEAAEHFSEVTTPLVLETLSTASIGVSTFFRSRLTDILGRVKAKTSQIRANGDHDTTTIERWIAQTENKITRSLDKEIEAQTLAISLSSERTRDKDNIYSSVVGRSEESLLLLREASGFLREIVTAMKVSNK